MSAVAMTAETTNVSRVDTSLAARAYVAHGWAIVAFNRGSKGPTHKGWNRREQCITTADEAGRVRANIGLAHAYSGTCVLDLDDVPLANGWLAEHGLALADLFDAPDAVRISSGRANRGKLLYRLPPGIDPLPSKKPTGSGLELRCATAGGRTVQDVLPPSIHPITHQPYRWEYADPMFGDWRSPPTLPPQLLELWQSLIAPAPDKPQDPVGIDLSAAAAMLERVEPDCDYDDWIAVGMALHHEYEGHPDALLLWDKWSSAGLKYRDFADLSNRWQGFGQTTGRQVTIQTLMRLADVVDAFELQPIVEPEVMAGMTTANDKPARFTSIPFGDVLAQPVTAPYFIKGVLPRAALTILFGESGAGKSFIVLDMCMAIARGLEWRGHRVRQGRVVYVCTEGQGGFLRRVRAYGAHHQVDGAGVPFRVVLDVPDLLRNDDVALARQIVAAGGADLIVIDTLMRATAGGDENSSEDMGKALAHAQRLHLNTGADVLLVHHAGKDLTKGSRGWSGLKGAADTELEVSRLGLARSVRVSKAKDGLEGVDFPFSLRSVTVGIDEDQDEIVSAVVEHVEAAPGVRMPKGPKPQLVLSVAREHADLTTSTISVATLVAESVRRMPESKDARGVDRRKEYAERAIESLKASGFVDVLDDVVTVL